MPLAPPEQTARVPARASAWPSARDFDRLMAMLNRAEKALASSDRALQRTTETLLRSQQRLSESASVGADARRAG